MMLRALPALVCLLGLTLEGCGAALSAIPFRGAPAVSFAASAAGVLTALSGLPACDRAAQGWDVTARLARIEGGPVSQGYMSGDWNYFYVASGQARDMLRVERSDRSVRWTVLRREQGLDPLGTPPLLDSDRAVAVAARKGMPTDRLERLILDQDNPPRRMVWTFESKAGRYRVDARTGQFLP